MVACDPPGAVSGRTPASCGGSGVETKFVQGRRLSWQKIVYADNVCRKLGSRSWILSGSLDDRGRSLQARQEVYAPLREFLVV